MRLYYCYFCNKPFNQDGFNVVCDDCVSKENRNYKSHYDKLCSRFDRIDFRYLAQKMNVDARLMENLLRASININAPGSLLVVRKGACLLCNHRHMNRKNTEPLCLSCLNRIEETLRHMPQLNTNPSNPEKPNSGKVGKSLNEAEAMALDVKIEQSREIDEFLKILNLEDLDIPDECLSDLEYYQPPASKEPLKLPGFKRVGFS